MALVTKRPPLKATPTRYKSEASTGNAQVSSESSRSEQKGRQPLKTESRKRSWAGQPRQGPAFKRIALARTSCGAGQDRSKGAKKPVIDVGATTKGSGPKGGARRDPSYSSHDDDDDDEWVDAEERSQICMWRWALLLGKRPGLDDSEAMKFWLNEVLAVSAKSSPPSGVNESALEDDLQISDISDYDDFSSSDDESSWGAPGFEAAQETRPIIRHKTVTSEKRKSARAGSRPTRRSGKEMRQSKQKRNLDSPGATVKNIQLFG